MQFNADKKSLAAAPAFDMARWPDMADQRWTEEIDRFYSGPNFRFDLKITRPIGPVARLSQFVGREVRNERDEKIGKVEDAVVSIEKGKIRYAAVGFGGILGFGEKIFAVPFSAIRMAREPDARHEHLVLNVDKAMLDKAPGFNKDRWPDFADPQWAANVDGFYCETRSTTTTSKPVAASAQPATNSRSAAELDAAHVRVSQLNGLHVENQQGDKLGTIDSLVVALQDGTVRYVAVSVGGFLKMGDKLVAVPWQQIAFRNEPQSAQLTAVVEVTKDSLEWAPSFDKSQWPDVADAHWSQMVDKHYRKSTALSPAR